MQSSQARLSGLLATLLLCGCAAHHEQLDKALLADRGQNAQTPNLEDHYQVHAPDRLEITIRGELNRTGHCPVNLDGRVELGPLGGVRVEGRTVPQIKQELAQLAHVSSGAVEVRVVDFNSQQIYLSGPGNVLQHAVAYHGPETVLDFLQRVGGLKPGAAPEAVYVIRAGIAEGKPPEVFHVDLQAILSKQDTSTNVPLAPYDQVYVGETNQSCLLKAFPRWLQPLGESLCGLNRP